MCGVTYKRFDFSRLPRHVVDLYKYSWKPIVILVSLSGFIVKKGRPSKVEGGGIWFFCHQTFLDPNINIHLRRTFPKRCYFHFFKFQEKWF